LGFSEKKFLKPDLNGYWNWNMPIKTTVELSAIIMVSYTDKYIQQFNQI